MNKEVSGENVLQFQSCDSQKRHSEDKCRYIYSFQFFLLGHTEQWLKAQTVEPDCLGSNASVAT